MNKFNKLYHKIIFESSMDNIEAAYYAEFNDELKQEIDKLKAQWILAETDIEENPHDSYEIQDNIMQIINEMFEDDPITLIKVQRVVTGTTPGQKDEIDKLKNILIKNNKKDQIPYFEKLLEQ